MGIDPDEEAPHSVRPISLSGKRWPRCSACSAVGLESPSGEFAITSREVVALRRRQRLRQVEWRAL